MMQNFYALFPRALNFYELSRYIVVYSSYSNNIMMGAENIRLSNEVIPRDGALLFKFSFPDPCFPR